MIPLMDIKPSVLLLLLPLIVTLPLAVPPPSIRMPRAPVLVACPSIVSVVFAAAVKLAEFLKASLPPPVEIPVITLSPLDPVVTTLPYPNNAPKFPLDWPVA